MAVGSAFHARTLPLAGTLSFRDWAGFYAVSAFEAHHEHEYNAIRNGCALIDISPLFKYHLTGPDAVGLVDRVITRDASKIVVGQVVYTPWCDDDGKVIDDGTVARLAADGTAGPPPIRTCAGSRSTGAGLQRGSRGRQRAGGRAGPAGPDLCPTAGGGERSADRDVEVLPRRLRINRRGARWK